eukprot:12917704-Prorocentrum_lima.AAC.1
MSHPPPPPPTTQPPPLKAIGAKVRLTPAATSSHSSHPIGRPSCAITPTKATPIKPALPWGTDDNDKWALIDKTIFGAQPLTNSVKPGKRST